MATKEDIHRLADKKGIPWDDDPKFKKWSKDLTGGCGCLDKMSPKQLAKVKKALAARASKEKTASRLVELLNVLKAMPKDEAVVTALGIGFPAPGTSLAFPAAYKGAKSLIKHGPPGSAQRTISHAVQRSKEQLQRDVDWEDLLRNGGRWKVGSITKTAAYQGPQTKQASCMWAVLTEGAA